MKTWKKVAFCIWAALPFITLASIKKLEIDTICYNNYMQIREKDYQARYDEGYDKGFDTGVNAAYHRAKVVTFDVLMGTLEEMGVFDREKEVEKEEVKTALQRTTRSI